MDQQKPYALSCDRNSEPLLQALIPLLKDKKSLFEVGAGTGQHGIYMTPYFPELTWTLSDQKENHNGIKLWLKDFPRKNILGPLEYRVGDNKIPPNDYDVIFASNFIHMLSWKDCLLFFDDLSAQKQSCWFIFYGAFNYHFQFTSESNQKFDSWLKQNNPQSGVRNYEDVLLELEMRKIKPKQDIEMPSFNRLLVFEKRD